jgi:hypothetical protein
LEGEDGVLDDETPLEVSDTFPEQLEEWEWGLVEE